MTFNIIRNGDKDIYIFLSFQFRSLIFKDIDGEA